MSKNFVYEYIYPTVDEIIDIHDTIINQSGGFAGVRELGLIESVLSHIQNDLYYPHIIQKVAHLIYSINKNHAFNDGNKRTSLSAAVIFLLKNGWQHEAINPFIQMMEDVVVWVADNKVSKEGLTAIVAFIITKYIYGYEDNFKRSLENISYALYTYKVSREMLEKNLPKNAIEIPQPNVMKNRQIIDEKIMVLEHMMKYA